MSGSKGPNILWYCTDAQRYDTIHALGNAYIRTPNLDALVDKGVAFTRAYAQSTMCTPSRVSFLTGRYCASHHVYRNGAAYFPPDEVLVTKILADAGYDCALVGKLHVSSAKAGETRVDDGYRVFHWSNLPYPDEADHLNAYHDWLRETKGVDPHELFADKRDFVGPGMPLELAQSQWVTDKAIEFVSEPRDGPWMLSLNPFDPHPPYNPPQQFLEHYDPREMPPPLFRPEDLERQERFVGLRNQSIHAYDPFGPIAAEDSAGVDPKEFQAARTYRPPGRFNGQWMKCGYYGVIEVIDHHFGELIGALDEMGELDNTLIVFHSDHGEILGDHGLVFKGARFFDGSVRVPLIFSWPGEVVQTRVSDALVELVDIAPTLLEASGIEVPCSMQGKSLWPILTGQAEPSSHKQWVVSDFYDSCGYTEVDDETQATMTFDGRYKMVIYHRHDLGELFDLHEDPGEFVDLWSDPAHQTLKLEVMHRHIDAVMNTISAGPRRATQY